MMRGIYESRAITLAIAIVVGGTVALLQPKPTVASVHQAPSAPPRFGKPAVRFRIAPDSNEARFRVREELAGMDFPNDAIGTTSAVTGGIVFDNKGVIVRDSSRFVVDLTTLRSDKARRDNFIKENTLESAKYPTATFVPFELRGLPAKLPSSGAVAFQMAGQLMIHGFTRFTVWNVTARAGADSYTGTAKTAFTFDDFGMEQPAVPVVLSVNDTIRLEYDFKLSRAK